MSDFSENLVNKTFTLLGSEITQKYVQNLVIFPSAFVFFVQTLIISEQQACMLFLFMQSVFDFYPSSLLLDKKSNLFKLIFLLCTLFLNFILHSKYMKLLTCQPVRFKKWFWLKSPSSLYLNILNRLYFLQVLYYFLL